MQRLQKRRLGGSYNRGGGDVRIGVKNAAFPVVLLRSFAEDSAVVPVSNIADMLYF
jgi:hypothetical protein